MLGKALRAVTGVTAKTKLACVGRFYIKLSTGKINNYLTYCYIYYISICIYTNILVKIGKYVRDKFSFMLRVFLLMTTAP